MVFILSTILNLEYIQFSFIIEYKYKYFKLKLTNKFIMILFIILTEKTIITLIRIAFTYILLCLYFLIKLLLNYY